MKREENREGMKGGARYRGKEKREKKKKGHEKDKEGKLVHGKR